MKVNVHDAKTHFSKLLSKVAQGEEVIIMKAGTPIARLVPLEPSPSPRVLGIDEGKVQVPDDFDAPLPPDVLAGFES